MLASFKNWKRLNSFYFYNTHIYIPEINRYVSFRVDNPYKITHNSECELIKIDNISNKKLAMVYIEQIIYRCCSKSQFGELLDIYPLLTIKLHNAALRTKSNVVYKFNNKIQIEFYQRYENYSNPMNPYVEIKITKNTNIILKTISDYSNIIF